MSRLGALERVRGAVAATLVGTVYGLAVLLSRLCGRRHRRDPVPRRVAVVGTFYNANWFVAHAVPRSALAN